MIPTYDINNLTGNIDIMFLNIMKTVFFITIAILAIWLIASLIIWLLGAKNKSERAIKFGINNFIITVISAIIILLIPIIFNIF